VKRPGCTIIGTVVAKPEKREELCRIPMAQVAPTRAEAGCVSYDTLSDRAV
jgi:quinol monooxygenase YgiN